MAKTTKTFTIASKAHGTHTVTIPAEAYSKVKKYNWYLDAVGASRTLMARTRLDNGARIYLQRLVYDTDAKLQPADGNFLNCSKRNMKILGE